MADPFEVLGIPRNASRTEIEAAYNRLAEIYNPDRFQEFGSGARQEAQNRMAALAVAKEELLSRRKFVPGVPHVTIPRRDLILLLVIATAFALALIVILPRIL